MANTNDLTALREAFVRPQLQQHMGPVTVAEYNVVAHLRAWCHDGNQCPLCDTLDRQSHMLSDAYAAGQHDAITEIAEGVER